MNMCNLGIRVLMRFKAYLIVKRDFLSISVLPNADVG